MLTRIQTLGMLAVVLALAGFGAVLAVDARDRALATRSASSPSSSMRTLHAGVADEQAPLTDRFDALKEKHEMTATALRLAVQNWQTAAAATSAESRRADLAEAEVVRLTELVLTLKKQLKPQDRDR